MPEIKPCPFCGANAQRVDFDMFKTDPNFGGSCIECTRCQASTAVVFGTKENLYQRWNERVTKSKS